MMVSRNDVLSDVASLWGRHSRTFLDYVVAVASPVIENEHDQKVIDALKECHEAEAPINDRMFNLLLRLGQRPDQPGYALGASTYNFLRGVNVGKVFADGCRPELEVLESHLKRYEDVDTAEERMFRSIASEYVDVRGKALKSIDKVMADIARADAAAAGEVVEDVADEPVASDEEFPWHDEALSLEERMQLAEGKGLFEKLYAAMAQTDCTACGYDCEGYARAIADGEDDDLEKCAPGMDETRETLEKLMGK